MEVASQSVFICEDDHMLYDFKEFLIKCPVVFLDLETEHFLIT